MRLTGAAILSAHPKTLSRAAGLLVDVAVVVVVVVVVIAVAVDGLAEVDRGRSHDGRNADMRCILSYNIRAPSPVEVRRINGGRREGTVQAAFWFGDGGECRGGTTSLW